MLHTVEHHSKKLPDVVVPSHPIRLPGVAGHVFWRAALDTVTARVTTLVIELPNGVTDTLSFDLASGVQITREINDHEIGLSQNLKRQILMNARIISGLHLQLAMQNAGYDG